MKTLIIGYVWPEPRSSAAGLRTWNLIDLFMSDGHEVIFSSPSKANEHRLELERRGVRVLEPIEANDPRFDEMIAKLKPDLVVFDRFVIEEQFGWRVRENSPESLRMLDTQDLHFLRRARHATLKRQPGGELPIEAEGLELEGEDLYRELASIHRSDLTLVISDHEERLLRERFGVPAGRLQLFRFGYGERAESPVFEERGGFAMLGNFRHPPNLDGVFWFHEAIWPLIRARLPDAEVLVAGAYPSREAMELHDPKRGFLVKGWIPDPAELMRTCRVNLAPLRFGAGIKGKLSDGWWSGAPAVGTSIAAEGMRSGSQWGGLVADSAEAFAEAAVALHEEKSLWEKSRTRGFELMDDLFSAERNGRELLARLQALRAGLAEARKANITGSMLWHHTLTSTKYLSRWIELKNSVKEKSPS